jgi:hypothetical protein
VKFEEIFIIVRKMTEITLAEKLKSGPKDGIRYPISVQYCGNCGMPIEVSKITNSSKITNLFTFVYVSVL